MEESIPSNNDAILHCTRLWEVHRGKAERLEVEEVTACAELFVRLVRGSAAGDGVRVESLTDDQQAIPEARKIPHPDACFIRPSHGQHNRLSGQSFQSPAESARANRPACDHQCLAVLFLLELLRLGLFVKLPQLPFDIERPIVHAAPE
jgi:hypothetical protein